MYIKKQRYYFADRGLSGQSYGFSSSHVCMWDMYACESWTIKKAEHRRIDVLKFGAGEDSWERLNWTEQGRKKLHRPVDIPRKAPFNSLLTVSSYSKELLGS